jgi:cytidylate kinase
VAALKAFLVAPANVRYGRVALREGITAEQAGKLSAERERDERARYIENYAFDVSDVTIYDMVIDSSVESAEEIVRRIASAAGGANG